MRFSLLRALRLYAEGLWVECGGRPRIEAMQRRRLCRLVELARSESPLFRELYQNLPGSATVALRHLPVTRKRDLMAQFDRWLIDRSLTLSRVQSHLADIRNLGVPIDNVAIFRTSGSSGEPAAIVVPELMVEFAFAIALARMDKVSMKRLIAVAKSGTNVTITGGNGHFAGIGMLKLMERLMPRLSRRMRFMHAEQSIATIVAQLNDAGPIAALTTYPSMMLILVREKEAGRLKIEPKIIKTAGETLTDDLRERVAKAFPNIRYPILNAYASTECFLIGVTCSVGRQHLPEDWVILEAVDRDYNPVADGVLSHTSLLTVFANEVQPFIRYDLGDCIRFHQDACPCGSPFRSFEVEGRQATLINVRGVELSPLVFDLEHEQARRVQLVQTDETVFEIRLELSETANKMGVFDAVKTSVQKVFEQNQVAQVSISLSDKPPELGASGKFHEVLPLKI